MDKDFNEYNNMNFSNNYDMNDPMFNPIAQYEQAYTYYKYLCMQMDYKIKCKEYEKLCFELSKSNSNNSTYSNLSGVSQNKG